MPDRDLFDIDLLDDEDPFEIDDQTAHLFKHTPLGSEDFREVWEVELSSTRPHRRPTG